MNIRYEHDMIYEQKDCNCIFVISPIPYVHNKYSPTARLRADCLVETVVEGAKAETLVARAIKAQEVFMILLVCCVERLQLDG